MCNACVPNRYVHLTCFRSCTFVLCYHQLPVVAYQCHEGWGPGSFVVLRPFHVERVLLTVDNCTTLGHDYFPSIRMFIWGFSTFFRSGLSLWLSTQRWSMLTIAPMGSMGIWGACQLKSYYFWNCLRHPIWWSWYFTLPFMQLATNASADSITVPTTSL